MRLLNAKLGEVSEVASKDDFITGDEYESGTSETFPGGEDGAGSYGRVEALLNGTYYGGTTDDEDEESWQDRTDDSDSASGTSDFEETSEVYCQNCAERRHGTVCERCGHDSAVNACAPTTGPSVSFEKSEVDRMVALVFDERMTLHQKGNGRPHPERPDRLKAIMARILCSGLAGRCKRLECREATFEELAAVHSEQLIAENKQLSALAPSLLEGRSVRISSDLYMNSHTFHCARLAAGGSAQVAAAVARKEVSAGAAIVRPPGHHAESGNSMGFCFFNNAAVAAAAAQQNGARKVMIVDWDVHHGNGTQQIFEEDPSVLYVSLHRFDRGNFYPGTGAANEVGSGEGEGYSLNIPWDYDGMGDDDYIAAFQHVIVPVASEYKPDLIIVSAGFDAAEGDPLGGCSVTPVGYAHLTGLLRSIAPIVVLLEGGYNLKATAVSTEACLKVLLGETPPPLAQTVCPSPFGWLGIQQAIRFQCRYWTCLSLVAEAAHGWGATSLGYTKASGLIPTLRQWPKHADADQLSQQNNGSSRRTWVRGQFEDRLRGVRSGSLMRRRKGTRKQREKLLKSEWRYKILLAIHNNAMKVLWRRKRQMTRQHSIGSVGTLLGALGIDSMDCQQEQHPNRNSQPNRVFQNGTKSSIEKSRQLKRFNTM